MKFLSYQTIILGTSVFSIFLNAQTNNWNFIKISGDTLTNCSLLRLNDSSLEIIYSDKLLSLPVDSIQLIFQPKESHFGTGLSIGLCVGIVLGAVFGSASYQKPEHSFIDFGPGLQILVGASVGGLAGGLIGGTIGALTGVDEKYTISDKIHTEKLMLIRRILAENK